MQDTAATGKDIYFTKNHEWVDFHRPGAYVGICKYLFNDALQLPQIQFKVDKGYQEKGKVIATIHVDNSPILIHMPVDGRIVRINDDILPLNNPVLSFEHPQYHEWMALIEPSLPNDRDGLMQIGEYQLFCQSEILKELNNAHNSSFFFLHIGSVV